MSNSLAKKRRANLSTPPPPPISTSVNNSMNSTASSPNAAKPITLPQVLSIFEKRLVVLEKNARSIPISPTPAVTNEIDESIRETLEEYESRFEMLAEQINHIKDTLMKLQTFTMEVNKTLLEERVHIMGGGGGISFSEKAVFSELGSAVDGVAETMEEDGDDNDDN